jgi:REP element-mobilizing transposase RayT
VAEAFDNVVERLGLFVTACSIMNDHVHIVIMANDYRIEYLMGQLKGAATHALGLKETPWTRKGWKVFIFDHETLRAANHYVENNPIIARMQPQRWNFVKPLPLL